MDVRLDDSLNDFRDEVRTWLEEHLSGEFGAYRGKGLTGHEDILRKSRLRGRRNSPRVAGSASTFHLDRRP